MKNKKKAIAYLRVSKNTQDLSNQKLEILDFALTRDPRFCPKEEDQDQGFYRDRDLFEALHQAAKN